MRHTLLLVVDDRHLSELCASLPTWLIFHKELCDMFVVLLLEESLSFCDVRLGWLQEIWRNFGGSEEFKLISWPDRHYKFSCHREKMLRAYVEGPRFVQTEWFLKIDTDAICVNADYPLYQDAWFDDSVFVTIKRMFRPKLLRRMEKWGREDPVLKEFDPLDDSDLHGRMISWFMFGNTDKCREIGKVIPEPMPIPSQDICHSYVVRKIGGEIRGVEFAERGWKHSFPKKRKLVTKPEKEKYNPLFRESVDIALPHFDFFPIYDEIAFLLEDDS